MSELNETQMTTKEMPESLSGINLKMLAKFMKAFPSKLHSLTQTEIDFWALQKCLPFGLANQGKLADLMLKNRELIAQII